jgi:hypothetical protein
VYNVLPNLGAFEAIHRCLIISSNRIAVICSCKTSVLKMRPSKRKAVRPACALLLLTAVAAWLLCTPEHENKPVFVSTDNALKSNRLLLYTPAGSAVLDSSVVHPGAAAAAAAAAALSAAEEVKQLNVQLTSFRLRSSDLNVAFLPERVRLCSCRVQVAALSATPATQHLGAAQPWPSASPHMHSFRRTSLRLV